MFLLTLPKETCTRYKDDIFIHHYLFNQWPLSWQPSIGRLSATSGWAGPQEAWLQGRYHGQEPHGAGQCGIRAWQFWDGAWVATHWIYLARASSESTSGDLIKTKQYSVTTNVMVISSDPGDILLKKEIFHLSGNLDLRIYSNYLWYVLKGNGAKTYKSFDCGFGQLLMLFILI